MGLDGQVDDGEEGRHQRTREHGREEEARGLATSRACPPHAEHAHRHANYVVTTCIALERACRPGKRCPLCCPSILQPH